VKAARRLPLLVAASVLALGSTTLANAGGIGRASPGPYAFSATLSTTPVKAAEVAVVKQSCAQSGRRSSTAT
jgi:hypothetical protein